MVFSYKGVVCGYDVQGSGLTLVLLHGFLEDRTMFANYVSIWANQHQVVSVDLLGHGETEAIGYVHTMEDQAAMVIALLSFLGIKKAVFLGHSMGGYVGLAIAEMEPSIIAGLIMQNSTSLADSDDRKINRDRAIAAVKKDYRTFVSLAVANLFSQASRESLVVEIARVREKALKTPLRGIIAALEGMKIRKDRLHVLRQAPFQILFISGKKDPVLPIENVEDQLQGTQIKHIVCSEGHMSHIENKEPYLAAVSMFLETFSAS